MKALLAIGALLTLANFTWAQNSGEQATAKVGQKIDNVKFIGLDGKPQMLHDFKGKKAVVVVFLTFDCPVSNSYLAELTELARAHKATVFLGVCTSTDEPARLARQVREYQVGFPVFQDARLKVADVFNAAITPEAFAEYLRCFRDPATIHATCEDYRASAGIDLEIDEADWNKKIACPVLALWAERGNRPPAFSNTIDFWKEKAVEAKGRALRSGHFMAEEVPEETFAELRSFLTAS